MVIRTPISEDDILRQLVFPFEEDLDAQAARALLRIHFDRAATKQINQLLRKNQRGKITAEERVLLDKYLCMGTFIDIIQAKARKALRKTGRAE